MSISDILEIRSDRFNAAALAPHSEVKTMMRFLGSAVRGLHMAIGIHTPPPEQESLYVYVWIGVILFLGAGMALMFYLLA